MAFRLFLIFFKIGAFSIGGGYAMLPFIEREFIGRGFLTMKEFSDILAISQMTPGPIAINSATFIGYKMAGVFGSIMATLGVVSPSFIMILVIAAFLKKFYEKEGVKRAFNGIRPAVLGLLIYASFSIFRSNVTSIKDVVLYVLSLILLMYFKLDTILVLILCGIAGIFLF
ncbi:chromate transporter [Thermobrachium celere]|uniref:Chromate transport protein n=1 Tax=Thermobrachium celere DSM 8682 TaxID=941824 RepID=R7RMA8_9CLOT|nr:chromate transporter [Thermobrachium celere]CDF57307.1 Chromate transport protein [Thermobrachium celere DSM 8682]